MKPEELQSLTDFALQLSKAAAREILPHFRKNASVDIKESAHWDPVTEGDRAGERAIRHLIEKHHPTHGIIGEEYGSKTGSSGLTWILDPVDGTRAFVIGLPTWATLIGLYADGKPLLGVMCQPFVGDTFYGHAGGAWLDHRGDTQAIRTQPGSSLKDALIGTTAPHLYKDASAGPFQKLTQAVKTTRFGLDCYSFALMAAGHMDIAMDPTLQIYDIAALIPIMQGAGATVGSWTNNDPAQGGNVLCAASQELYNEALAVMQS
jgi:myo-inositol-1(or 4)-monophosphatase